MLKESQDVVKLIRAMTSAIQESRKDGDLDWFDIPKFAPVVVAGRTAIEGADKIDDEIKAATSEELIALTSDVLDAAMKLMAAITAEATV